MHKQTRYFLWANSIEVYAVLYKNGYMFVNNPLEASMWKTYRGAEQARIRMRKMAPASSNIEKNIDIVHHVITVE
jgi:hypothetical protein